LAVLLALSLTTSCGGDFGPPDLATVRDGLPDEHHVTYSGASGRTVLELLEEHASAVETSGFGEEFLVTSINGVTNGDEGRFWFYYVNGQPGQVAASELETATGDRIEWVFAK
jgi:hypothetical protein